MNKLLIMLAIVAIFAVPVIGALQQEQASSIFDVENRIGPERVSNFDPRVNKVQIDDWVYLEPSYNDPFEGVGRGGYAPMFPRSTALVKSTVWNNFPESYVSLSSKDLPVSERTGAMFEAWLVDDDTGYRLSMGTFTTVFGGSGQLRYRSDTYLGPYDRIEITAEPFDDLDVTPGPVLLSGKITKDYYFTPGPKQAKMVTTVIQRV